VKATSSVAASPWSSVWSFSTQPDRSSIAVENTIRPRIYPIPAHTLLTIDCQNTLFRPLVIYNTVGLKIIDFRYSKQGTQNTINVSSWASGSYLIILSNNEEIIHQIVHIH